MEQFCLMRRLCFAGAIPVDMLSRQAVGGGGEEAGSLQQAALLGLPLALTSEPWRMAGVLHEALLSAEVAVCSLCCCLSGLYCLSGHETHHNPPKLPYKSAWMKFWSVVFCHLHLTQRIPARLDFPHKGEGSQSFPHLHPVCAKGSTHHTNLIPQIAIFAIWSH